MGEGHWSEIAEPGQWGPQDHLLQVQRSRALSSAFAKRPWNFCSGPGGRETSPSPQGRCLAPRSLRPHLEHAQVASGCVGRGSAGGWGDSGETAGEELGGAGVPAAPPGWAAPACPPRGRSRCRPARRTKPPAPTPRGRFALVLPGHGFCDHCCQSSSALCVPAPSGLPLPLACLSLICSLCQSPQREYPLPGRWQAASVRPLKAEPALRACTSPRLHPQPTSTSSNLRGPGSGSETQPALKYVIRCTSLKSRGQLQAQACWVRCQRPSPSSDTGCLPGP